MKLLQGKDFDGARFPAPASYLELMGIPEEFAMGDEYNGFFTFASPFDPNGAALNVVASSDGMWDHVSVSLTNRCPIWAEMEWVKRKFFKDDEVAMQLHVAPSNHVNVHPYTLHLWRPIDEKIPLPSAIRV